MKKIYVLLSLLAAQVVFSQQEDFKFIEVENSGLPTDFKNGSMIAGEVNGQKAVLITGNKNWQPTTALYVYNGDVFQQDTQSSFQGIKNGEAIFVDIDNDNDLDIAMVGMDSYNTGYFLIYENNQGVFTEKQDSNYGLGFASIDHGDYDKDGDQDIIITGYDASYREQHTYLFKNNDGTLEKINTNLQSIERGSAKFIDIYGDGNLGVVMSGVKYVGNEEKNILAIYQQNDSGEFDKVAEYNGMGYEDAEIVVTDINKSEDDLKDFIVIGGGEVNSAMFKNKGDGTFERVGDLPQFTGNNSKNALIFTDLNNDNLADLVIAGKEKNNNPDTYFYKGNGDFGFTKIEHPISGENVGFGENGSIASLDYDNDGDLDLIIMGQNHQGTSMLKLFRNETNALAVTEVVNNDKNVWVYPNPVINTFKINGINHVQWVKIIDLEGKVIKTFSNQDSYDISNLTKGNYIVVVMHRDKTQTFKIIKK